ncbi:MAG: succinate--CoA ligase subunit beta [Bacteroidetes bacterium GWE2_41_25]|nr:MAG: succinate--CoA ligase subunit beta [Bacteroidetes bacterium GWA2_40_15]OFX98930.1 MAG: succinate--CoA ligase subunit beta [Bacteroidetes bacterium GWC2_40_22]OFY00023.1 MAG: succinate--CoA ligase subunit beta [Bacteroidetes bacterium GWE2_41_25]OFY59686.1 MAG: succinate--CoA ligase subunit beta [Bacteroidetes bacterium GWF2_41_9]HAM10513.1 ADP-forming succinate--CoA ligase subunit beta [Bacteroidales bacterium]
MNIHEFQGKSLLKAYNVDIQEGFVAETPEQAVMVAKQLQEKFGSEYFVVKAQIHAGGRGKGGGVKLAKSLEDVKRISGQILGMQLVTPQTGPEGKRVNRILIAQDVYYKGASEHREFYISLLLNRNSSRNIFMYSPEGGMSIEEVAEKTPDLIFTEEIDPGIGLQDFQTRNIAFRLGLSGTAFKNMQKFLKGIYETYTSIDAQLLEINPVLKTSDNRILAVDCKLVLDDNALFRHPELLSMRDINEEDPVEVEAGKHNLNFVKLDGNVGCMVNGAGLAMATMDIIKLSGGSPANFLDVGGGASPKTVEAGFRIILKDPEVKAILINIFGGIVRCDRVANGVVEAYKSIGSINVPVIVRLQGTNAIEAKQIIDNSGLEVFSAVTFSEAAELVTKVLNR